MKDDINKELEGLSPKLAKLKKSTAVPEVPKNLFHNMQQGVIQELNKDFEKSPVQHKEAWWKFIFKPIPSLAFASFLALVAVGIFFNNQPVEEGFAIEEEVENLSEEEILAYIDSNIDDFESASLLEITDEEDEYLMDSNIDDATLNEYLDNNSEYLDDDTFEHLF